ncbi:gp16 family protein [Geoalkalibacter halelectricus]|uniref:gp16 family protein n=1 Tax=Geoalkalibacter halelectricus TaxID=2847045 RepID=UPI003D2563B5
MATPRQIKLIHTVKSALGMDDDDYRALLMQGYGVSSSKSLSAFTAAQLLADLEQKAAAAGVWTQGGAPRKKGNRPRNIEGTSRAGQLQKIEALLTVGGKSWNYGDALAKRICKVDKIAWVPDGQLYKIITALRKQAQREGWDLSGEQR